MIDFEVNITSYKYPGMVNNLIEQIRKEYPDVFIRVWDNSPERMTFVGANEIRWHRFNPSLSRVWNWAIAQTTTPWAWVSNDDIQLLKGWRKELENEFEEAPTSLWHGPSRCFFFNKKLLDTVGWFDERFCGLTWEDLDYIRRMNHAGVSHHYGNKSKLDHYAASLKGEVLRENHPHKNSQFFEEKYDNTSMTVFEGVPKLATPDFYPLRPR